MHIAFLTRTCIVCFSHSYLGTECQKQQTFDLNPITIFLSFCICRMHSFILNLQYMPPQKINSRCKVDHPPSHTGHRTSALYMDRARPVINSGVILGKSSICFRSFCKTNCKISLRKGQFLEIVSKTRFFWRVNVRLSSCRKNVSHEWVSRMHITDNCH